jgi:hypothetical protein
LTRFARPIVDQRAVDHLVGHASRREGSVVGDDRRRRLLLDTRSLSEIAA